MAIVRLCLRLRNNNTELSMTDGFLKCEMLCEFFRGLLQCKVTVVCVYTDAAIQWWPGNVWDRPIYRLRKCFQCSFLCVISILYLERLKCSRSDLIPSRAAIHKFNIFKNANFCIKCKLLGNIDCLQSWHCIFPKYQSTFIYVNTVCTFHVFKLSLLSVHWSAHLIENFTSVRFNCTNGSKSRLDKIYFTDDLALGIYDKKKRI